MNLVYESVYFCIHAAVEVEILTYTLGHSLSIIHNLTPQHSIMLAHTCTLYTVLTSVYDTHTHTSGNKTIQRSAG